MSNARAKRRLLMFAKRKNEMLAKRKHEVNYERKKGVITMENLGKVLTSKKFYAMVVGLIVVFFGDRAGLDADQLASAVYVVISYIVGQGLSDSNKAQ